MNVFEPSRPRLSRFHQQWLGLGLGLLSASIAGCMPHATPVTVVFKSSGKPLATAGAATTEVATAATGFGNLGGHVTYDGTVAPLPPLVAAGDAAAKDASVCAAVAVPNESLLVNSANQGLMNAVIFLEKRPATINPELTGTASTPAVFDQKGCRFFPHLVAVQVGQTVTVKSDDSIAHNTHTFPLRNSSFNQAIKAGDRAGVPLVYDKPEKLPLEVKCDLHPWMRAYHFPVDHPYVAISDVDGKFEIRGLPAGKHVFQVWHERGGLLERKLELTITAGQDTTHDLKYGSSRFTASAAPTASPAARHVSFQQVLRGGTVIVSQSEGH